MIYRKRGRNRRAPHQTFVWLFVLAAGGATYADEPSPGFSFGPGEIIEHDSNVFRSSGTQGNPAVTADTLYTTELTGSFHETYGREQVSASATVGHVQFQSEHQYNFTQEDIRGALLSSLPYNVDASIDAARTVQLARFADIGSATRDVINNDTVNAGIYFPLAVDWRAVLGGNATWITNSAGSFQTQDLNSNEIDGGIRFQPTTGNHVDLLLRTVHGTYPNGSPSAYISPGYRDRGADLRVDWTFTGASRALGRVGYVQRRNDELLYLAPPNNEPTLLNRDFSGPAIDLTYIWQISAATKVSLYGLRQTGASGDNSYLSSVNKTLRVTPSYTASAKIRLDAYAEWSKRDYFSDVYAAVNNLPPGTTRLDYWHNAGVSAVWNPRRWLQVSMDLRREHRDSTIASWTYVDNVATLSLQGIF